MKKTRRGNSIQVAPRRRTGGSDKPLALPPVRAARGKVPVQTVSGIPPGRHTVTPSLTVRGAAGAIEFYVRAFGATELVRMPGPDGERLMHAAIRIGDSVVFLSDEDPDMGARSPDALGGVCASLHLYVPDVDVAFQRAVDAGARVKMPVADMFWGDRYGQVVDPFGHEWGLATHREDLSPSEIRTRAQAFFARLDVIEQ